jgi:hypothetical protein
MKLAGLGLVLVLFASGCAEMPQYMITPESLAKPAEVVTNRTDMMVFEPNAKVVVGLVLSADAKQDFQKFLRENPDQPVKILINSCVVLNEISRPGLGTGFLNFYFATREQAQAFADFVNKK